jgi:uncharacterized membrane protein YfcA
MTIDPLFIASGAGVGFIIGMTGVGGGSLMTPILVLLFGVHPVTAVGTDLLYAAVTKGVGSVVHGLRRNVAWQVVGLLAAGSVPATATTLMALSRLGPMSAFANTVITVLLAIVLLITAFLIVVTKWLRRLRGSTPPGRRLEIMGTIATGAVLGFLVSITSVGAGAIGVTALLFLYPNYPAVRIVGTDVAHAVPLTLVAGIGHWLLGSVNEAMLGALLLGSVPGIAIGSQIAPRVPERRLRLLLAVLLLIVSVRLMVSSMA